MLHGTDWNSGPQLRLRKNVIRELKKYGGKLVEIPYTKVFLPLLFQWKKIKNTQQLK